MNTRRLPALCLGFFLAGCMTVHAQVVSLGSNWVTLKSAFDKIEKVSKYRIAYNSSQVDASRTVTIPKSRGDALEMLKLVLQSAGCAYEIDGSYVTVHPQQSKSAPKSSTGDNKRKVSGNVVDANGEPVIGATVMVKGTNNGAITDIDGNYTLTDVADDAEITISYIGFTPHTYKATDRNLAKVTLQEDSKALGEVVVVGYGVQSKRDVSTAISQVKASDIAGLPNSDFRQSLVGKMPGVTVMQPSGDPEGAVTVRIRGVSSATAGNEPLYIVDGVAVEQGLTNLNQNDIESVEVLKDASSAAIYGSRGSNGVIIITTKKGASEKATVSYDGYVGWESVTKKIDMLNAYQYAEFVKDGHDATYFDQYPNGTATNGSRPQSYMNWPIELYPYLEGMQGLTNTDWQDEIFRTGFTQSHNISVSGKTKNTNYFLSGNYMDKEGIIICSDFKKYSLRVNLDGQSGMFKYGINFSPSYSKSHKVDADGSYSSGGIVQSALVSNPMWPVYNADGSYNFQGNGYWRIGNDYQVNEVLNPVALANLQSNVIDRVAMVGKIYAGFDFTKDVSFVSSIGGNYYGAHNDQYRSKQLPLIGKENYGQDSPGKAYSSSGFYYNWIWENQLTYNHTFNKSHKLNVILVQSAQKERYKGNNVSSTDYPNDNIKTIDGGTVNDGSSNITEWTLASWLARAQYSYKGRYMLSAAIRADGSSRFGENNRWGYFPSASAAWRISDEGFFKKARLKFVEDIKLRISYGKTGNFNIGNYQHLATMSVDNYVLGGKQASGYKPTSVANPDLTWEKTGMMNIGADITLWGGYLALTAEYYNSNTTDMLLTVPVSYLSGYGSTIMNIGKVNNHGVELSLSSSHEYKNGFGYTFNANFAKNVNEVKKLGANNTPIISTGSVNHAYWITEVGKPIGSYYLLVQDGIFENEEQMKAYPHFSNTRPGDFRFVDVDKDGVLDTDKDRAVVGNYMPDFTYGFGGSAHYKGIDFQVAFQGVYGNEILNLSRRYIANMEGNLNSMTLALDRWRSSENPGSGKVNRANRKASGYNARTSTWHIEDGSYLRLQTLTIGYTLPQSLTKKLYVSKLRIYFSGNNLFTWTDYSGYNPEVSLRASSALTQGEDYGTYPLSRTFTVGANITF